MDYVLIESIRSQIRELSLMFQVMKEEAEILRLRLEVDRLMQEVMPMELPSEILEQYIQLMTSEDEDDYIEQDQEDEEDHE
ncbi:MAG: hypothetical protein QW186_07885 [Candidatus Bathyarchaeia archaeon]